MSVLKDIVDLFAQVGVIWDRVAFRFSPTVDPYVEVFINGGFARISLRIEAIHKIPATILCRMMSNNGVVEPFEFYANQMSEFSERIKERVDQILESLPRVQKLQALKDWRVNSMKSEVTWIQFRNDINQILKKTKFSFNGAFLNLRSHWTGNLAAFLDSLETDIKMVMKCFRFEYDGEHINLEDEDGVSNSNP